MKIIHITQNNEGYEIVTLVANRYSKTNSMHVIEKDGEILVTGGFILNDTPELRSLLDSTEKEKQYDLIKSIVREPFVKMYAE